MKFSLVWFYKENGEGKKFMRPIPKFSLHKSRENTNLKKTSSYFSILLYTYLSCLVQGSLDFSHFIKDEKDIASISHFLLSFPSNQTRKEKDPLVSPSNVFSFFLSSHFLFSFNNKNLTIRKSLTHESCS